MLGVDSVVRTGSSPGVVVVESSKSRLYLKLVIFCVSVVFFSSGAVTVAAAAAAEGLSCRNLLNKDTGRGAAVGVWARVKEFFSNGFETGI